MFKAVEDARQANQAMLGSPVEHAQGAAHFHSSRTGGADAFAVIHQQEIGASRLEKRDGLAFPRIQASQISISRHWLCDDLEPCWGTGDPRATLLRRSGV